MRLVFFTRLSGGGGHTTTTLEMVRLPRRGFGQILMAVKEIPGHGTSRAALEAFRMMGVEILMLDGGAVFPRFATGAGLMRHLSPIRCSLRGAGSGDDAQRFQELSESPQPVKVRFDWVVSAGDRAACLSDFFTDIDDLVVPRQDELEGIHTVILESLGAGVPVVMTRAGGMRAFDFSWFGCGVDGCIGMTPEEVEEPALLRLAEGPRPEPRLQGHCRAYFRERFSDESVGALWERVFLSSSS